MSVKEEAIKKAVKEHFKNLTFKVVPTDKTDNEDEAMEAEVEIELEKPMKGKKLGMMEKED